MINIGWKLIFTKYRRFNVVELFSLKQIYSRCKIWQDKHRDQPEGFIIEPAIDHIKKKKEPKAKKKYKAHDRRKR